jgi:hypothetical protein
MNPIKIHSLVVIHWNDIYTETEWNDKVTIKPATCVSTGWLIGDFPDYVVIASDILVNTVTKFNGMTAIPRGCITMMTEIPKSV